MVLYRDIFEVKPPSTVIASYTFYFKKCLEIFTSVSNKILYRILFSAVFLWCYLIFGHTYNSTIFPLSNIFHRLSEHFLAYSNKYVQIIYICKISILTKKVAVWTANQIAFIAPLSFVSGCSESDVIYVKWFYKDPWGRDLTDVGFVNHLNFTPFWNKSKQIVIIGNAIWWW